MLKKLLMLSVLSIVSAPARAQDSSLAWAARLETEYRVVPNITYLTLSNYEAKLDLYVTRTPDKPLPTLIWIHGGGWTGGVKETSLGIPAYLAMGMNVVNVEYRLARTALAPAAVEDCRCALRWVIQNAKQYGIDVNRLVVAGGSAGGHLALTTGMLPGPNVVDRGHTLRDLVAIAQVAQPGNSVRFHVRPVEQLVDVCDAEPVHNRRDFQVVGARALSIQSGRSRAGAEITRAMRP